LRRCPAFLFILSSHAALPDLHSFPTRRSSDLGQRRDPLPPDKMTGIMLFLLSFEIRFVLFLVVVRAGGVSAGKLGCRPLRVSCQDRKSTRLNSSHVKISYAVFCLKKKKKNNVP